MTQRSNDNSDRTDRLSGEVFGAVSSESMAHFLAGGLTGSDGDGPRETTAGRIGNGDGAGDCSGVCPPRGSYLQLALGSIEPKAGEFLLSHAAGCMACAEQLKLSLAALEGSPSAEETSAIAELAASKAHWQEAMARELAGTQARKMPFLVQARMHGGSGLRGYKGWAMAGLAAGLVLVVSLLLWQRQRHLPERELAMAYTQARSLELRIPGAKYAGLMAGGRTRGTAGGDEPAPLLEARARLAQRLQSAPQDQRWLQLQARADVLEERYDAAIDVLDRLLAIGPVTTELLVDGASAYYQRGRVSGNELDRATALDYLRRADAMTPTDPVVLFNEAIVMEDRGQIMNAVEVWNRYLIVERDAQWAAEGKRKLAALETTLNRLKSHESRVREMLATPAAMDALAGDGAKLAKFDEEFSSVQLDRLLAMAFPVAGGEIGREAGQARGSPMPADCAADCLAARRLLHAIARSLELQHHDFWLTDLLSPNIEMLPKSAAGSYAQAIRLLGQATREDQTGVQTRGRELAARARGLFGELGRAAGIEAPLRMAARVGERRAAVEELFALQRMVDFRGCRALAGELKRQAGSAGEDERYTWMHTVALITEKVCDDTPETRAAGRAQLQRALQVAEASGYGLLVARARIRYADDATDAEDGETAERIVLATLRDLFAGDPPPLRIFNSFGPFVYVERDSPRAYASESYLREALNWTEAAGDTKDAGRQRLDLVAAEIRIGQMEEFEHQLALSNAESRSSDRDTSHGFSLSEGRTTVAQAMLERGDINGASQFMSQAAAQMDRNSDVWFLHRFVETRAQLELMGGNYNGASASLESDLRASEGKDVRGGDREMAAEYAEQDHDLYGELAAAWLGQGRSPESVLALWERFRLRSRGLPIEQCTGKALDCEARRLKAEQSRLGKSILIGQIVLLDRVLVYRMDANGVTWSQRFRSRQDLLDMAQKLERAVSSPYTTLETAETLGWRLSDCLLPAIPAELPDGASLLLEPDPLLQNLSWPVLPVGSGPLGLRYAMAETRSILADGRPAETGSHTATGDVGRPLIVGASLISGSSGSSPDKAPLPEALEEARTIAGVLHSPGRSPQVLVGNEATTGRVADALATATLFHFAGHAVQRGDGTELLLAASSPNEKSPWVDGTFLHQHPPRRCRLAVLSACSTGERAASWRHPLQDIVETLESEGVPEVVATRWQIDSVATVPFMQALYAGLEQGNTAAMALSSARRLQSAQSSYRNPYYWGAYYVTGREVTHLTGDLHARLEKDSQGKERRF